MIRKLFTLVAAFAVLVAAGGTGPSVGEPSKPARKAPVDNWGDWWPASQFDENEVLKAESMATASRAFDYVQYGAIRTQCGISSISFRHQENGKGLRLDVSWSGPGTMATEEEWEKAIRPEAGDVAAAIVHGNDVVREPTNGEPRVMAWFGGGLGTTGAMTIEFDCLPNDFEDYWFRVDVKEERFWFLIPYGLGSSSNDDLNTAQVKRGRPMHPVGAKDGDVVRPWNSVKYRLYREAENNNLILSATISNTDYARVALELYREKDRWTLDAPRTSAAYLWPNGYTRFGSLYSLTRHFSFLRADHFQFFHHGHEVASWGILRITLEDKATDICIPSSLLHARHGSLEK